MEMLPEFLDIYSAFVPVDIQTAQTGDWVSMKGFDSCTILFFKGAGTGGDDPTLTLAQATVVAGSDTKALTFTTLYTKTAVGATLATMSSSTVKATWTKVTQTAAATYTDSTSAEVQAIWAIPIAASMLDTANNFCCLNVSSSDVGSNAQIGCGLYLMHKSRYSEVSAIVD